MRKPIRSFSERSFADFQKEHKKHLIITLKNTPIDNLMYNTGYKKDMEALFHLAPLALIEDSRALSYERLTSAPKKIFSIRLSYSFQGHRELFQLIPSVITHKSHDIELDSIFKIVSTCFKVEALNQAQFDRREALAQKKLHNQRAIKNLNKDLEKWNQALPALLEKSIEALKKAYICEKNFFQSCGIQ